MTPVQIVGNGIEDEHIVDIQEKGNTYYALTQNGEVYAWGSSWRGVLGIGEMSTQIESTPKKIEGISHV